MGLLFDDSYELPPAGIRDDSRETAIGHHTRDVEVLNVDHLVLANQRQSLLVVIIQPSMRYRAMCGWIALEMLEAPDLGNEDAGMPKEQSPGKPTTRRYSPEEKAAAVRMVRALRAELGTEQGTVQRVARQLGYGVESVRMWVRQADIDEGLAPGVSTAESARVKELEQENRELKRANEILKRAASFFGAELDRQHKK
jgi:transposase